MVNGRRQPNEVVRLTFLDNALPYYNQGLSVVPAQVVGKWPLVKWKPWQQITPDPEQLRIWAKRWPQANVAIITGRISGLVVIDIDRAHDGFATLEQLEQANGRITRSAVVETPSGGRHIYLQHPGGRVRPTAGVLGPGVDVRGDGGLVLAPPSRRASGQYRWIIGDPGQVPPMPEWLRLLVQPPPRVPREPVRPVRKPLPFAPHQHGYWQAALAGEVADLQQKTAGTCHGALVKSATRLGSLHHLGMTEADVDRIVEDLADAALTNAAEPRNRAKALETARECFENGTAYKRLPKGRAS